MRFDIEKQRNDVLGEDERDVGWFRSHVLLYLDTAAWPQKSRLGTKQGRHMGAMA